MPTLLLSFKKTTDSRILIHGFLAPNEKLADKDLDDHAAICPKFGPAVRAEETIEHVVDVDEIPEFTEEAIEEWVNDLFGLEDDEADDEEEDDEDVIDVEHEDVEDK